VCQCTALWDVQPIRGNRLRAHCRDRGIATPRRHPHVTPFADPTQLDMENLMPKDALLDAIEDDYDIEWNTDPFEDPDRVDRESQEELVALIQYAGPPELQAALRALCSR